MKLVIDLDAAKVVISELFKEFAKIESETYSIKDVTIGQAAEAAKKMYSVAIDAYASIASEITTSDVLSEARLKKTNKYFEITE